MAPHFIFEMNRVSKRFGDKTILQDISLSFYYGAKIGVVGENGAGKSTLFKNRNSTSTRPSAKTL